MINVESLLNVGLYHYLILSLILFCIGMFGLLMCKNIIKILFSWQIILCSIGLNFVSFAVYVDSNNLNGFSFQLFMSILGLLQVALVGCFLLVFYKKSNKIKSFEE